MPDPVAEHYRPRDPIGEAAGLAFAAPEPGRLTENGLIDALVRAERENALLFLAVGDLRRAVILARLHGQDMRIAMLGGHPNKFRHETGVAWVHDSFGPPAHALCWMKPLIRWGVAHGRLVSGERMAYRRASTGRIGWVRVPRHPQGGHDGQWRQQDYDHNS